MNKHLKKIIAKELESFNLLDDKLEGIIDSLPLDKKVALYKAMSSRQLTIMKELLNDQS